MLPKSIIPYIEPISTWQISNSGLEKANANASVDWHLVCDCIPVRKQFFILAGLLLTGCATQPPAMQTVNTVPVVNRASAALVFDAPITTSEPSIDISRDDRGATAFMGFDEGSTTQYDVFSYNRQTERGDRYVQQEITERSGTLQR